MECGTSIYRRKEYDHVRAIRGRVVVTTPGTALLDDPKSFGIRTTSGVVALDGAAVTALLNEIAFNYPGVPLKHLTVRIENGQLIQKGILHKGVDIPFEMWSNPVLKPDGRLKLHPDKLTIFGVNGNTLMHALGLHLEKMMDLSGSRGASVKGDDIYLDPLKIIPPPVIDGRLSAVRIEGNELVQEFARTADDSIFGTFVKPDSGSKNFVYFRGGQLRFGKLTMTDTDLLIHDADEADPFDLYFLKYNAQLVAGHTKNLPNLLRTWMVDYAKLAGGKPGRPRALGENENAPVRAPSLLKRQRCRRASSAAGRTAHPACAAHRSARRATPDTDPSCTPSSR